MSGSTADGCAQCSTLPSTVPQIEGEVAHEAGMAMLDVDGCAQPPNILCDVIAENDRAHGRFAGARLAHQQYLLLPLPCVHGGRESRLLNAREVDDPRQSGAQISPALRGSCAQCLLCLYCVSHLPRAEVVLYHALQASPEMVMHIID